jgi:hypothetical protein
LHESKRSRPPERRQTIDFSHLVLSILFVNRRFNSLTVQQASEASPTLAALAERARDAQARLAAIQDLIPTDLRSGVQPGPAEGEEWCMLVGSNAAAAKLRQLVPSLLGRLRGRGWQVSSLRIKVRSRRSL